MQNYFYIWTLIMQTLRKYQSYMFSFLPVMGRSVYNFNCNNTVIVLKYTNRILLATHFISFSNSLKGWFFFYLREMYNEYQTKYRYMLKLIHPCVLCSCVHFTNIIVTYLTHYLALHQLAHTAKMCTFPSCSITVMKLRDIVLFYLEHDC